MSATEVLQALIISGIMGMIGQGIRAVIGLKSASTLAAQSGSQQSAFDAAYFALSLMIGAVAGVIAGFGIGLSELLRTLATDQKILLALAASGYAGADFIENAMTNFLPPSANATKPRDAADKTSGDADATAGNKVSPPPPDDPKAGGCGGGTPPTAAGVRQTAQAALAILNSMQPATDALGPSPLALLHRAADGKPQLQSQLNAAVSAYSTVTASLEKSRALIGAVTALTNASDSLSPDSLITSGKAAKDQLEAASALNNSFSSALATFKQRYDEISRATANG